VIEDARRAGDPAALYADSSKAQQELGWEIQYPDVTAIIETAWRWHQANPEGYAD
jgi:UDP-glucose 4-epimerase